jgi:hypothetical protein
MFEDEFDYLDPASPAYEFTQAIEAVSFQVPT